MLRAEVAYKNVKLCTVISAIHLHRARTPSAPYAKGPIELTLTLTMGAGLGKP
jgi:hypothetical protein